MSPDDTSALRRFREHLAEEYDRKFPRSRASLQRHAASVLDSTSHAIRWNDPFMPVVRRAQGAEIEDLDGHRILDYWQGHYTNVLGHNPDVVLQAMSAALADGRGLQTGMLHEIEGQVAELICRRTGCETCRLTTSGSLGTFYAVVLARAFTGRDRVLKVSGGWHGSQPFGLKGVAAHGGSFDHLESEGLSGSTGGEILLARFNDVDGLRKTFSEKGDRIACFLIEPILGAGGGMTASREYLREARRLTEKHGALLLCDEIITGFRFRAGDLSSTYGVRPDLMILGKVLGGGMPVAAVAGRGDVLELATRRSGRVKFEGGTFSAHELSLVATLACMRHLIDHEHEIYPRLATLGLAMRRGIERVAADAGLSVRVLGAASDGAPAGSLVFVHPTREGAPGIDSPEDLTVHGHPRIDERLMKSVMLLEELSTRSGLGAISTAHSEEDLERTLDRFAAGLRRLAGASIV